MIAALFFDPTRDVGGTPAGGNYQVRPGFREHSRVRSFETKPRCAEASEQKVVKMYGPGETQLFDFVRPSQGFCETERLCGVSRVIVGQYPHSRIAAKAPASLALACDFSSEKIARMRDELPVPLRMKATRSFKLGHPPGLGARQLRPVHRVA